MRQTLQNPVSDTKRKKAAVAQARDLYRLHEAGRDYTKELKMFSETVGVEVTKLQVDAAFGSTDPKSFAEELLASHSSIPIDLNEEEMFELIENVSTAKGTQSQIVYWLKCLKVNTGDDRLSDLIFWPGEYFGDGNNRRELTPREILNTALENGKTKERQTRKT